MKLPITNWQISNNDFQRP